MAKQYAKPTKAICITARTTKPLTKEWQDWQPPFFIRLKTLLNLLPWNTQVEDVYRIDNSNEMSGEINVD